MKVLNKKDKDIYESVMSVVEFKKIDCSNCIIPKGWMNDIKRIQHE